MSGWFVGAAFLFGVSIGIRYQTWRTMRFLERLGEKCAEQLDTTEETD